MAANQAVKTKPKTTERWDRADCESHYLKTYKALCAQQNKQPTLTLLLRSGKRAIGTLVEYGQYSIVIDMTRDDVTRRAIVFKHAIDSIRFGVVAHD